MCNATCNLNLKLPSYYVVSSFEIVAIMKYIQEFSLTITSLYKADLPGIYN